MLCGYLFRHDDVLQFMDDVPFIQQLVKFYFSQDESVLARIRTDQRMARREGWMDNLAATLMGSRPVRKRSTTLVIRYPLIKVDILLVVSINFP